MREALITVMLMLILGACAAMGFVDPAYLLLFGRRIMLVSVALAVPFELAYFAGLALAARRGDFPRGWYWRSFDHHERLRPQERRWVLGCFAVGSLCMLVSVLGIVTVAVAGFRALHG